IVTGASRGIGAAILDTLARSNATVVGTATTEKGAEAISNRIAELGAKGAGRVLDVREGAACAAFADRVQADFGAPSILVNNAGVTRDNLLARMKDEEWDDIQATNLRSVFLLSRAVLRGMMKARAGRIVNVTSVVGFTGNPGQTNCVAPGFIETDMTRALAEEQVKRLVENVPLGRLGKVDDIAQAVLFLCSPA